MADIFSDNNSIFSNLKTLTQKNGQHRLLSNGISSLNFDGSIPKTSKLTHVFDIKPGDTVFLDDPYNTTNQVFITDTETRTITVDGNDVDYYFLYYLSEDNVNETFTYNSSYSYVENGITYYGYSEDDQLDVFSDDPDDITIGENGWAITNNGNAVFSNVFVRGRIEATDGIFDGILDAGIDDSGNPLVSIGKDIFAQEEFMPRDISDGEIVSGVEAHGLYINPYTFLLSYNKTKTIYVNKIIASNSSDETITTYSATLKYSTLSFTPTIIVGMPIDLSGFDYGSLNGFKIVKSKDDINKTFTVDVGSDVVSSTSGSSNVGLAENGGFDDTLTIDSITLNTTNTTVQKSNLDVYFLNASDTSSYNTDSYVMFGDFLSEPYLTLLSGNGFPDKSTASVTV